MSERSYRETEFLRQAREKLAKGMGGRATTDYFDTHHLCHYRNEWNARPEGKALRQTMLAPDLYRGAHNLLHLMCPPVPVPNYQTLQYVLPRFNFEQDIYGKIDQYSRLVTERTRHPKMKPIERDMCELSVEAVRMQIPFIREGTLNERRSIIV